MKTQINKWIRWGAAGVFGLMLTLNVMVGLEFGKDKVMPSLTLVELGNQANAQSESGGDGNTSCTVTTQCYDGWGRQKGTVSCTAEGDRDNPPSCIRTHYYVECNGARTKC